VKKLHQILSVALVGALLPLSAQAQSGGTNTCGMTNRSEALQNAVMQMLGPWHVNHQAGYVVVGGMSLPYPNAGDNETITFERTGNQLIATSPEMQEPMVFRLTEEPPWKFLTQDAAHGITAPPVTFEDMGLAMGCDAADMPRLIGTATASVEGMNMKFTMRVMIGSLDIMYGVLHMEGTGQGYAYYSRRTVLLTR